MLEAYKVGITIALTNKVSQGLALIGRDLAATDAKAVKLNKTLGEMKSLATKGLFFGGIGYAGLKMLEKPLEAAKQYQQALGQFKAIGLGDAINGQADKFARGSSVIGASATDLIETVRDLHTALGDFDMAKSLAPQIAQMKFANSAAWGAHGMDFGHSQLQAMEKIIEMKGGFKSPGEFMHQADMMQKVISGTGGMVKPSDYLSFIKTAGVSGRLLNNEMFYYTMEPLIQEMTGHKVGTGTMSAYNNLAQGRSTNRAATEMMKLGILDPTGVLYNKIGNVKQINPGALKGMDEYTSNPYQWMKDVLLPNMAKRGITSEKDVLDEMGVIFGNRTGSNLFSLMFLQQEKIQKNMGISKNAMGTRELYKLALTTPEGSEKALAAAWQNLNIAMGRSLWPIIIPGLNKLADELRSLGRWVNQHPIRFKWLILGFAGLSTALAFSGAVLLLKAAFLGLGTAASILSPTLGTATTSLGLMAAKLTLVGAAAYGVYQLIANHEKVAGAIDNAAPEIGDTLLRGKDWLNNTFRLDGSSRSQNVVPPAKQSSGGNGQGDVYLDSHKVGTILSAAQANSGSKPLASPGGFDGYSMPIWSGM